MTTPSWLRDSWERVKSQKTQSYADQGRDAVASTSPSSATTFTRPSYAPGVLEGSDGRSRLTVDQWAERLGSRARGRVPYRYPVPPPRFNPVTYNADGYNFRPSWDARNDGAAVRVAGYAHDSLRSQPITDPANVSRPVSWNDPIYERFAVDSEGQARSQTWSQLSEMERWAWINAAEALGGGPRTGESTYGNYLAKSSMAVTAGYNRTAWDFLMDDIAAGFMPQNILGGPNALVESDSSSSSYSSYSGGGGYGGGGGGGGGSVSLTNPTSARGLLMQTMQSVLGRNPSNDEYKTFLQVLNEAEMANPNTASFEGGTTVGSGGVDPGVLALEFAQDQEDFQERQGDRYFRTFMQALAGGV